MKTLFLVRHARAASQEPKTQDIDRQLTKKGRKDAQRMAKKIRKSASAPQLIISSPAKRALKTARIFANEFNYAADAIVLNGTIYEHPEGAGEAALLETIRSIEDQYQSVMIVGHDPLLTNLAKFLQRSFKEELPVCSVAEFEFPFDSWSQVARWKGKIKFFDYPGRKKQLLSDMEAGLRESIETELKRILGKIDKNVAERMAKSIRKGARKLAMEFLNEYKTQQKKAAKEKPAKEQPEKEARAKKAKIESAAADTEKAPKPKSTRAASKPVRKTAAAARGAKPKSTRAASKPVRKTAAAAKTRRIAKRSE